MRTSWWRCLVIGGVLVGGYAVLPESSGRNLLYELVVLAAIAAIAFGIRYHKPVARVPWTLVGVGFGVWIVGDIAARLFSGNGAGASVAAAINLLGYVALVVSLSQFANRRMLNGHRIVLLDALVVATPIAFATWALFFAPLWAETVGSGAARLADLVYPIGDLLFIFTLVYFRSGGPVRMAPMRLLLGAVGALFVGDVLFQVVPHVTWLDAFGRLSGVFWLLGYVLCAAAALHPEMAGGEALPVTPIRLGRTRRAQMAVISCAVALVPIVVIVELEMHAELHLLEAAIASILVIGARFLRVESIAGAVEEREERLAKLAGSDPLTGVANRRRLGEVVSEKIADDTMVVPLLLVVLDRFNEINTTLGHEVGDELLCAASTRMTDIVGTGGMVARIGGDTFGIVLDDDTGSDAVLAHAARMRTELAEPFPLSDITLTIDAVIGIAIGPIDGADIGELLQRADVALSIARGRSERVARYSGRMPSDGMLTPHLMTELPAALEVGDVVVHYQPQVEVASGRVVGLEVLVRWMHPVHGMLPPSAFLPAAERTGLIRPLTLYVLDRALAQSMKWREVGREFRVAVNISVRDLLDMSFVADVRKAMARHQVPAGGLELEITETMAMVDPNRSIEVLKALRAAGVCLAIDDFGTGRTSLACLQRLPVARLKIDRSFVTGLLEDEDSVVVVESTIEMARCLGMAVVAEGVEDDATLLALRGMRCQVAQGFGLGRPVAAEKIPNLVDLIEQEVPRVLRQRVPVGRRMV